MSSAGALEFRDLARAEDRARVRAILESTRVFYAQEIGIALELLDERIARGPACGYHFLFAERGGQTLGYTCYGPIGLTQGSFDLYWIGVDAHSAGGGVGRALLERSEERMRALGARQVYIETSSRDEYARTRAFYLKSGYAEVALLRDFYAPGDHKHVYARKLEP